MTDDLRAEALKGNAPDRTNDCPPPEDRNATEPCPKCDARMVGRMDSSNSHQGWWRWFWWCGGCGSVKDGGIWHPPTQEELVYERWKNAQKDTA